MLNFKCFSHRIGIVGTKGSPRDVMLWPTGAGGNKSHRHGTYLDQPTQLPLASPSGLSQGAVFSHMCVSREGVLGALVTPAGQTRAMKLLLSSPLHTPVAQTGSCRHPSALVYDRYPTPFSASFSASSRAGVPSVSSWIGELRRWCAGLV